MMKKKIMVKFLMNLNLKSKKWTVKVFSQKYSIRDEVMTQREHDLENLLHDLEGDLKKRMELNWKLLFTIDEVSKERNFFYNLLLQIEGLLHEHDESEIKDTIQEYLAFVPKGFEAAEEDDDSGR